MIAVDTSALMAIVLGEAERESCVNALYKADGLLISSGTLIETLLVAHRRGQDALVAEVETLIASFGIEIVPPAAAEIAAAHDGLVRYGKGSGHAAGLNFGDLFSYALAKARDVPLLYKGDDFAATDVAAALTR